MNNIILISFIVLLSGQVFAGCPWYAKEDCEEPMPPPKNALELKQGVFKDPNEDDIPYTQHRPENWPVRAFYTGNNFVYEFDKQGNVLIAEGKAAKGYMVETYKGDNPAWKGDGQVYYWHNPDSPNPEPALMIVLTNNKACYAMPVAEIYSFIRRNQKDYKLYLDGDCAKAEKVKENKQEFWAYPQVIKDHKEHGYNYGYIWQVQYFDDPKSPIYNDWNGECLLYCDVKEAKK